MKRTPDHLWFYHEGRLVADHVRRYDQGQDYLQPDHEKPLLLERRIKAARFPFVKTLDDFDWSWPKKINRAQIQHLFHLDWLSQHGNVFILGGGGLGKTHLALALAYRACHQGYSVRWATAIDLVNTLLAAQHAHGLQAELKTFLKPQLPIIDELGYPSTFIPAKSIHFQPAVTIHEQPSIFTTEVCPF